MAKMMQNATAWRRCPVVTVMNPRSMVNLLLFLLQSAMVNSVHEGDVSNYLEVFRRYEEISTFDPGDFYKQATTCEHHGGLQWTKLTWCIEALTANTQKRNISSEKHHWTRPLQPGPKANVTSCSYSLRNYKLNKGELYFTFEIVQANCTAEWYKGGSSFEITATGDVQKLCSVKDNFDNTYMVTCNMRLLNHLLVGKGNEWSARQRQRYLTEVMPPLEPSITAERRESTSMGFRSTCTNITIRLDFEHFDAFSERAAYYERQFAPLQIVIADNVPLCPEAASTSTAGREMYQAKNATGMVVHGDGIEAVGVGMWVNSIYVANDSARSSTSSSSSDSSGGDSGSKFVWRWQHAVPVIDLTACLTRQRVVMMGASHCRYNWDALALAAFPAEAKPVFAKLPRHHMAMKFHQFEFQFLFFSREYAPAMRKVCDDALATKNNVTLLIQPGSWDSTFWPAQQFIHNPESVPSMMGEIRNMMERGCGNYISFVWVQQVPYPNCLVHVPDGNAHNSTDHCADERRARNNQKISLMNAYIERELRKLHAHYRNSSLSSSSAMRLQIVPAYDIIAPRLQYGEYVCNNHFLCRYENDDTMAGQTAAGLAVLETVRRAVCRP